MKIRYLVLLMLVLLSIITYLDRICIGVAGSAIQKDLEISDKAWGWVLGAFLLSYGIFEIPSGAWGDRFGQRKVLTRIVLWWSIFVRRWRGRRLPKRQRLHQPLVSARRAGSRSRNGLGRKPTGRRAHAFAGYPAD
jgi:hypothetical protein